MSGSQIRPFLAGTNYKEGLHVLDPASVWAVLGPRLDLPDRVALGDSVIRTPRFPGNLGTPSGVQLATPEALGRIAHTKGRPGRRLLIEALPLLRDGAVSAPETHLRLAIVDAGMPEPELDVDVYDCMGRFLGCSELAYPEFKIALEYEGDHHRTKTRQWNRDLEKYEDYKRVDWEVIRVTKWLLYSRRKKLLTQVRDALARRGWRG
ncbi:hypothetical protein G7068_10510 [Leucobacter viscericola]|uniref:DUF559 domain-containing protein n=1 Tax=Leucobacter viscericola TaxID=2714935 RepID=A0A6G7XG42_9MICO|nr:hypothetical protein [Leucobacter viscericola]QIK63580.1 hypothetical protein G7068_10510 [Leucobacter viscericola]